MTRRSMRDSTLSPPWDSDKKSRRAGTSGHRGAERIPSPSSKCAHFAPGTHDGNCSCNSLFAPSLLGRYYDPSTDQFLSVDPDVADTGQAYAFTGDDPLNSLIRWG